MISKPRITFQEWRWAIGWSVAILLLSCVPYLIALLLTPNGWQFAGFLVNPLDGHSYMAKMRQGFEGSWLFHLTYTPEPHNGAFIFTFYLALGHLAALNNLPLIWIFHLARLLASFLLLVVAFRFVAYVTPQANERRLAFIFILTASGFGWLGAIFGAFPIDLWVPEAFVPYSIYANPHFPLAMALMLIIFQLVVWPPDRASHLLPTPYALLPGLAALALAIILPFALLTVWAVLAVFISWIYLIQRRLPWLQIWPTLGVVLFSAPVIGYDYWVSITNPIMAGWSAQNITSAPSFLNLLLGYGLIGLLAAAGGWFIARGSKGSGDAQKRGEWLILWWAVTTLVLVYLPLDLQRRLINGLHLPLAIMAAIGLSRWLDNSSLQMKSRRLITNAVIAIGVLGTIFVWTVPLLGMLSPPTESETTALFFLRQDEIIGFNWLRENATAEDVVLASSRLGMFVPGQTGLRAYYGHPFETIEADKKKETVEAFYRGESENAPPVVDFIIYGPSEQALGRPAKLLEYPVAFSTDDVFIYRVVK